MMRFGITVEYEEHKLTDYLVERVVGRKHVGSGFNLKNNTRDLQFEFGNKPAVAKALRRLIFSHLPLKKAEMYPLEGRLRTPSSEEPRPRRRVPR